MKEATQTLKLNKAARPDNIDPEHRSTLRRREIVQVLTLLFNALLKSSHVPSAFRHGLVIPIPKGANKDLSIPTTYRGITILSNISKSSKN